VKPRIDLRARNRLQARFLREHRRENHQAFGHLVAVPESRRRSMVLYRLMVCPHCPSIAEYLRAVEEMRKLAFLEAEKAFLNGVTF
jgi:hypothetical protein